MAVIGRDESYRTALVAAAKQSRSSQTTSLGVTEKAESLQLVSIAVTG